MIMNNYGYDMNHEHDMNHEYGHDLNMNNYGYEPWL